MNGQHIYLWSDDGVQIQWSLVSIFTYQRKLRQQIKNYILVISVDG